MGWLKSAGRFLGSTGAMLVVLFFFMPWFLVSCNGETLGYISGWQLEAGFQIGGETVHSHAWLLLFLALAFVALWVAIAPLDSRITGAAEIAVGGLLLLLTLGVVVAVKHEMKGRAQGVSYRVQYGLIGMVLADVLIAGGGGLLVAGGLLEKPLAAAGGRSGPGPGQPSSAAFPESMPAAPPEPFPLSGAGGAAATLVFRAGPLGGQRVPVQGENILLGRGSACDVRIPDKFVSRQHARLRYARGRWFIQDQESAGGTFVNGRRVAAAPLKRGDRVRLGQSEFVFLA